MPRFDSRPSRGEDGKRPLRLAILGAGPVGVEAALYSASLKLPFTVYERGRVGEHLQQWGHVKLFTPFGMNTTSLGKATLRDEQGRRDAPGDGDLLTGKEHLAAYLEPLANSALLREHFQTQTTVVQIGRHGYLKHEGCGDPRRGQQPFRLLLRNAAGQERVEQADVVLDCTGVYGNPRRLGEGGVPAVGESVARPYIACGLEDVLGGRRDHYADRNILVVGAGHSAATTVCLLASLAQQAPGTWIVWLARRPGTQPLRRVVNDPLRERDQLCARANMLATRGEGNVEFHPQAVIDSIEMQGKGTSFTVYAHTHGEERAWQVDRIIANVGGEPDNQLYRELQIHECFLTSGPTALASALLKYAGTDPFKVPSQGAETLRNPEPGFFILGNKSYGRNSNFLLRTGFEQVRDVFTLIVGKPDLDLYKKAR